MRSLYVDIIEAAELLGGNYCRGGVVNADATRKMLQRSGIQEFRVGRSLRWRRDAVEGLIVPIPMRPPMRRSA